MSNVVRTEQAGLPAELMDDIMSLTNQFLKSNKYNVTKRGLVFKFSFLVLVLRAGWATSYNCLEYSNRW